MKSILTTIASLALSFQQLLFPPPISPYSSNLPIIPISQTPTNKVVYGFLPYWNTKLVDSATYQHLTHLNYFNFVLDGQGNLVKNANGYRTYKNQDLSTTLPPHLLTLVMMDQEDLNQFFLDIENNQNAMISISNLLSEYSFTGINLDFEPTNSLPESSSNQFTQLVKDIRQKYPSLHLSVSIYATAAIKPRLWQLSELNKYVDHFVVMTYDYHQPSSYTAGPVAPLYGSQQQLYKEDIMKNLHELTQIILPSKILLGLPLYGYQWQTIDSQTLSQTFPNTGKTIKYFQIPDLINSTSSSNIRFDRISLTPYLSYQKNQRTYVVHYDDYQSLSLKLDLVNQGNLGGIALWALGYEGSDQKLWQIIDSKLIKP